MDESGVAVGDEAGEPRIVGDSPHAAEGRTWEDSCEGRGKFAGWGKLGEEAREMEAKAAGWGELGEVELS